MTASEGKTLSPHQPHSTSASSIQITTRTDLSLLYRITRRILRPLRPNLVRPGKPQPSGSPRLSPPKKSNCDIVESKVEDVWQYTFIPKGKYSSASAGNKPHEGSKHRPKHRIYFFNGGGFQSPPSSQHWRFVTELAKSLSSRTTSHSQSGVSSDKLEPELVLVSYPLAPNSPAEASFPILQKWLSSILHTADLDHEKVSLMGDSSGGNIALSLGFFAIENHISPPSEAPDPHGRPEAIPSSDKRSGFPLASIIAISPAVDLRNTNPAMHEADKHDPILTIALTSRVARAWASKTEESQHLSEVDDGPRPHIVTDAQLSPLLNTDAAFAALVKKGVKVHGVIGTHDVLSPDALLFMRRCEDSGVEGSWLIWEGQMHCFPLAAGKGPFGISEAKQGTKWIEEVIRSFEA